LVAVQMSGRPLEALDWATITTVLGSTIFGRAWVLRAVLALALAGMSPVLLIKTPPRPWALVATIISGALLGSLAWSGHANAQVGPDGVIHHLNDLMHLLAAGAWLGGLAPLAAVLRQVNAVSNRRALAICAKTVTRFGNAAAFCVGALVMTGIVNACYLLPDWSSLVQTTYGRLLLFKICAFLIMLAIAGVNRKRLTPALNRSNGRPSSTTGAAQSLRRNVFLEQVLGALVILLVAALGVSPPPMRM
jgi:putative copper resistance protein D